MKKWQYFLLIFSFICFFSLNISSTHAFQDTQEMNVVHAILFYSPSCGHCHLVITETLAPLTEEYGNQLQIIGINVASEEGQQVYQSFLESWQIPDTKRGVPTLVFGDQYLVGSGDIPAQFPNIVENGLKEGGINWPEIPGLAEIITQALQPTLTPTEEAQTIEPEATVTKTLAPTAVETEVQIGVIESTEIPTDSSQDSLSSSIIMPVEDDITIRDRLEQDLAGNILAIATLIGMVVSVIWILVRILTPVSTNAPDHSWTLPVLSVIGIVVASYLSFVEVTQTEAVCGPIGDCNTVQQSPYAVLFGFLPVGVLGLLGYLAIIGAWLLRRFGPKSWYDFLTLSIWGMALFGTLFSIYLTFLEPFVIGATCAWCVTSAIIITAQLWVATEPVRQIWRDPEEDIISKDHKDLPHKLRG